MVETRVVGDQQPAAQAALEIARDLGEAGRRGNLCVGDAFNGVPPLAKDLNSFLT